METFGVTTVESQLQPTDPHNATALSDASDELRFDGKKLAKAILEQALEDVKINPYGKGENERFGQDKERLLEVIGEAQWFLLDDNDHDAPHGFIWCCTLWRLDPSAVRRKVRKDLEDAKSILPKVERHRLAALAGDRRLRKHFARNNDNRKQCATPSCTNLTKRDHCSTCTQSNRGPVREVCVKCEKKFKSPRAMRRAYCPKCSAICVRERCRNPRRPGWRTTTCREHHREERKSKNSDKGKIYARPKPSPSLSY